MTDDQIMRVRAKAIQMYLLTCGSKEVADHYIEAMKDFYEYKNLPDKCTPPTS